MICQIEFLIILTTVQTLTVTLRKPVNVTMVVSGKAPESFSCVCSKEKTTTMHFDYIAISNTNTSITIKYNPTNLIISIAESDKNRHKRKISRGERGKIK